jgi:hypothetical protein
MSVAATVPNLNLRDATMAAFRWGAIGSIAAAIAVAVFGALERWYDLTLLFEYREWMNWCFQNAIWPVLGSAVVFAGAGWVANVTVPIRSLALSLFLVTSGSLVLWTLLGAAEITPRRYKSVEHPAIYPSEFLVLVTPPILVAAVLTSLRCTSWTSSKGGMAP